MTTQSWRSLKAAARQRLAAGQGELDLGPGLGGQGPGGPLQITSSRMGHLLDALGRAYDVLGFGRATAGDEVFRQLVLARIIEPASKLDSLRVLEEAGEARGVVSRRSTAACRPTPRPAWRQQAVRGLRRARQAGAGIAGAV